MVTETTLGNNNPDVYGWIHANSLPYWIRITVANLAYQNQEQWAYTYFNHRSGTYNNMWIVIDFGQYQHYKSNINNAHNIIWFIEEFYSLTSAIDVTQQLLVPQGYVASYNVPYNQTLQQLSQDETNYTTDPRYFLFKKYAPGIQNLEQFEYVMRLNNLSDTHNYCQAISSRCDLNPVTTFPWGAIDAKLTTDKLIPNHESWIISGPTSQSVPVFSWNNWPEFSSNITGMPMTFNFDWVFISPSNNFSVSEQNFVETIEL